MHVYSNGTLIFQRLKIRIFKHLIYIFYQQPSQNCYTYTTDEQIHENVQISFDKNLENVAEEIYAEYLDVR